MKSRAGEAQKKRVKDARPAAFGESRDRDQSRLRVCAVVRRTREIKFGLDADIDAFGRARCAGHGRGRGALAQFFFDSGTAAACWKGRPDWESSGRRWPRRARYCSRRRETSTRHSGSGVSASESAPTVTGSGISPFSTAGTSQKEQLSVSSSKRAPHFEQIRITGPFCAAEVPVERANHITTGDAVEGDRLLSPCGRSGNSPCATPYA